jgi:hypothetical protein
MSPACAPVTLTVIRVSRNHHASPAPASRWRPVIVLTPGTLGAQRPVPESRIGGQ